MSRNASRLGRRTARRRRATGDRGSTAIELVAAAPLLLVVTIVLIQGYLIVTGIEATTKAARDGARAAASGADGDAAAGRQMPEWVSWEPEPTTCAGTNGVEAVCYRVVAKIPYGFPGVLTKGHHQVVREATFPRGT